MRLLTGKNYHVMRSNANTPQPTWALLCLLVIAITNHWAIAQEADSVERSNLSFYGTGNIQQTFNGNAGIPANAGVGVNYTHLFKRSNQFLRRNFHKLELDASINVASTVDTLKAEYENGVVTN